MFGWWQQHIPSHRLKTEKNSSATAAGTPGDLFTLWVFFHAALSKNIFYRKYSRNKLFNPSTTSNPRLKTAEWTHRRLHQWKCANLGKPIQTQHNGHPTQLKPLNFSRIWRLWPWAKYEVPRERRTWHNQRCWKRGRQKESKTGNSLVQRFVHWCRIWQPDWIITTSRNTTITDNQQSFKRSKFFLCLKAQCFFHEYRAKNMKRRMHVIGPWRGVNFQEKTKIDFFSSPLRKKTDPPHSGRQLVETTSHYSESFFLLVCPEWNLSYVFLEFFLLCERVYFHRRFFSKNKTEHVFFRVICRCSVKISLEKK